MMIMRMIWYHWDILRCFRLIETCSFFGDFTHPKIESYSKNTLLTSVWGSHILSKCVCVCATQHDITGAKSDWFINPDFGIIWIPSNPWGNQSRWIPTTMDISKSQKKTMGFYNSKN